MTDDQKANDECGICLETLTAAVTLPCNHKFCADCLHEWKSKFGSSPLKIKEEKSKSCPLCRKNIPPSKDMMIQLDYLRKVKRDLDAKGETTSSTYKQVILNIKRLEEDIGDYDGEGLLDYDGCIELPKYIYDAVGTNDIKRVMKWLGSPVDMNRLNARYPGQLNANLVHLASYTDNSDLLSILLQYGAGVNAVDAQGWNPLIFTSTIKRVDLDGAKILLEWGVEISFRDKVGFYNKDEVIEIMIEFGNTKLANLVSSEFGVRRCEVINLPNHPQLNGKTCVVEKYIAKKDKYKIIFEGSGNAALVGPNNLKRRDRTPLDCGYYVSFKNGRMTRREFATKEECQAFVSSLGGGDVKSTAEELASLKI